MGKALRTLLVEDIEQDAALLLRELKRGGYDVTHERVDTEEAMLAALEKPWDIVLSDYTMPRFSGALALKIVRELKVDLPFIIVSGTVSEDLAVEAIHAGAQDFMAKGKLSRLVPAIERELRDVKLRAEQKKMQDQLLISDRMASLGTLAAGVAHEINNPLACIMANLDLLVHDIADGLDAKKLGVDLGEIHEELRDAKEAAQRIRDIVQDLKIFSRVREDKTGPVDVVRVMESTLRMAWNEIRHRARLVKQYGKTPLVEASESRLGQVFLNLIVNASQAISEGHSENNEIRISTWPAANGDIIVAIEDTGPGMPPEVLNKLFTPFFTTKPVGIGTGLGLSICHRIITGFGGTIEVLSEVGKGTTFHIALKPARGEAIAVSAQNAAKTSAQKRGHILVVDDEPMIIRAVQRVLSPEHDVSVTNSAFEALQRIRKGDRFDVILCDVMMPQMSGMDLHAELLSCAEDQATRMVFLTGGTFTTRAREFLDENRHQRLEKPFDTQVLRSLVNDRVGIGGSDSVFAEPKQSEILPWKSL